MILGLTGGIGSGKTSVALMLKDMGFEHIDADLECRKVTEKGSPVLFRLSTVFGSDILDREGNLNRKQLAEIVFSDKEKLKQLNTIVQLSALDNMLRRMEQCRKENRNAVFDVPLLFETGWEKYCDVTLTVSAHLETRVLRVMKRDNLSVEQVMSRVRNQLTDAQREEKADMVVYNNADTKELRKNVSLALAKYNI